MYTYDTPGSAGIVFLYWGGRAALNFHHCVGVSKGKIDAGDFRVTPLTNVIPNLDPH